MYIYIYNNNNHPAGTSSLKTNVSKIVVHYLQDLLVVLSFRKANGKVSFMFKQFCIKMLIKELAIVPTDVPRKSNIFNIQDINNYLIINQRSEYLPKKVKLKVCQNNKVCQVYAGC